MDEKVIFSRHSTRVFSDKNLDADAVAFIKSEIGLAISREACIHFQLVCNDSDPFEGFLRSYGMFRNARNYIACVADSTYENYLVKAGYYAEQIVIAATMRGLGTCIVSGTFDSSRTKTQLRAGWKVPFIIIIGWPEDGNNVTFASRLAHITMKKGRPSPDSLLSPKSMQWNEISSIFPSIAKGILASACAPSAMNKHPLEFTVKTDGSKPTVFLRTLDTGNNAQIDMGAAMFNFQAVAGGEWYFSSKPQWREDIEF